ncbi:MAG: von Willebrand factor type A domain-containing protein [Gemmatimonadales bacterium]|nr:von Willebrand factor type A domain-containing protein [Gemmatimonadales bacterium]
MKRYLNHEKHKLSDWEKENLWQSIGTGTPADGVGSQRPVRRSFQPALGLTATLAVLAVVAGWWIGTTDSNRGMIKSVAPAVTMEKSAPTEIVVSAPVAPISAPALRHTPTAGKTSSPVQIPTPAGGVIRGRVLDQDSGLALAHATVLIRGTNIHTISDTTGTFEFTGLTTGKEVEIQVLMLSYAPHQTIVAVPDTGSVLLALGLEPVIAETLAAFDVEGSKFNVEIKSDAVSRPGDPKVRRGRKGDVILSMSNRVAGTPLPAESIASSMPIPRPFGSVTGGTKPPNGEEVELMYFEHTGVNPFVATEDDSLSTFAVDVDNASWTLARNYLKRGMMPPKEAIRVEEFVNAFDAGWARCTEDIFNIHNDGSTSIFGPGYHLLRIGLVGKTVSAEQRKAANLVFVIDVSGSMNRENRLGLVKKALHILLDELQEGDRVGIVVYGSNGHILLEPTDIERRKTIELAIDELGPGGSTNAFEGLELAYSMSRRTYEAGKVHRLILCSDGVANHGASTEAEEMLKMIRRSSDEGITLSTIGFGMGNYNDVLMEKLADKGDGNYFYVDELKEAERVFRENLTGLLQTIAGEVKVQVEFDKTAVKRWRLLGYENRDVADRDFRNDAVDAGEVGSGHQVTALYEIKLDERPSPVHQDSIRLGTVRLRHEAPAHDLVRAGQVQEIESPILLKNLKGDFASGSVWLRTQAVVAEFAEILRGSYWAKESRLTDLIPIADCLTEELPGDKQIKELAELIHLAADIEEGKKETEDTSIPLEK